MLFVYGIIALIIVCVLLWGGVKIYKNYCIKQIGDKIESMTDRDESLSEHKELLTKIELSDDDDAEITTPIINSTLYTKPPSYVRHDIIEADEKLEDEHLKYTKTKTEVVCIISDNIQPDSEHSADASMHSDKGCEQIIDNIELTHTICEDTNEQIPIISGD